MTNASVMGLTPEDLDEFIEIEGLPQEIHTPGKVSILYGNPATNELRWEFEDIEPAQPTTEVDVLRYNITLLKQQLADTQAVLDYIILNGGAM